MLYSKIKDFIFCWNHVRKYLVFKLFSSKNMFPQKSCKVAIQRFNICTCIYICPWGFVISSFCKVTNLLSTHFQPFAIVRQKRLPFFVSFFGAFYADCLKDSLIQDSTIFQGLKSNEKDRLRGICVGLRITRNFTVLFCNETSFE